jgi:uncharacterized protein (DUF58 family)
MKSSRAYSLASSRRPDAVPSLLERIRARRPLWAVYPTPRLALWVLACGALWFVPGVGGIVAARVALVLVGAAAAFDYLRLPRRRDLELERRVPETIGLGDAHEIEYDFRSRWPWPIRVRAFDALPEGLDAALPSTPIALAANGEQRIALGAIAERRGRLSFGPVAWRVTTPMRLLTRIVLFDTAGETVVVPSLSNVRRFRLLAVQNRLSDAGVRALKQRGEGTSFAGLRDYVPGDDPRLLDWKATARHARLITREQTIERSQTVVSLIDCGRAMTQLAGRFSRFEHVLSAALVLSDVAGTSGDRVGMIAFDDTVRAYVPPMKGAGALRSLRTTLSGLDATLTEPDYASAFRLLATRQRRRALVVFFTDVIDVRTALSFVAHAGRGACRHLLVVVAIQNDELIAAARPNTSGSLALFRSAAAEELVREREEALARMRHAGITVLDVPAGRMAAAVVNRYLEIKARGLL